MAKDGVINEDAVKTEDGVTAEDDTLEEGLRNKLLSLTVVETSDGELTADVSIATDEVSVIGDEKSIVDRVFVLTVLNDTAVSKLVTGILVEVMVVVLLDTMLLVLMVTAVVVTILVVVEVLMVVEVGVGVTVVEISHSSELFTNNRGLYPALASRVMPVFSTSTSNLPG